MSILKILLKVDSIYNEFWWRAKVNQQNYYYTKSWDYLCKPKFKGGLGFKTSHNLNKALLAKLTLDTFGYNVFPS